MTGFEAVAHGGGGCREVEEDAVARGDQFSEVEGLAPGEAGFAAAERAVDKFADEAAVQRQMSGAGQEAAVAAGQVLVVGGARGVDGGEAVLVGKELGTTAT
jgi:hypothetical protein